MTNKIIVVIVSLGLYCIWGVIALLAFRALGIDVPITPGTILSMTFFHMTIFWIFIAALLLAISFAQPSQSAANLKAVTSAVRRATQEVQEVQEVQRDREEHIGKQVGGWDENFSRVFPPRSRKRSP